MSRSPSVAASAFRIFDLSLGQMLWSRRSVLLGLLLGGCVLVATVLRIVSTMYASGFKINGANTAGATIFGMMIWLLYIRFIVPVLGRHRFRRRGDGSRQVSLFSSTSYAACSILTTGTRRSDSVRTSSRRSACVAGPRSSDHL